MSKVLSAIAADYNYGYKIANRLQMSHGTIYTVLRKLVDERYVTVRNDFTDNGLPCKWYEVHPTWSDQVTALADDADRRDIRNHS